MRTVLPIGLTLKFVYDSFASLVNPLASIRIVPWTVSILLGLRPFVTKGESYFSPSWFFALSSTFLTLSSFANSKGVFVYCLKRLSIWIYRFLEFLLFESGRFAWKAIFSLLVSLGIWMLWVLSRVWLCRHVDLSRALGASGRVLSVGMMRELETLFIVPYPSPAPSFAKNRCVSIVLIVGLLFGSFTSISLISSLISLFILSGYWMFVPLTFSITFARLLHWKGVMPVAMK